MWLVLTVTTIGFAPLFSVYSYVSPILTGLAPIWVGAALAPAGAGIAALSIRSERAGRLPAGLRRRVHP